jgi:O-antigen/teichoic acid export membrane protein
MLLKTYLELKKLIKSQGKLFAGSGLLTFIRLSSGLVLLKITAIIGGNSGVAIYGQAHNMVSMMNGIMASGAGEGVIKLTAQNQDNPSNINKIKIGSILLISLCAILILILSSIFWLPLINWASIGNPSWFQIIIYMLGAILASIGTLLVSLCNGFQFLREVIKTNILSIITALIISGIILFLIGDSFITIIPAIYLGFIGIFQIAILIKKIKLPFNIFNMINLSILKQLAGFMTMAMGSFFLTPFVLITIRGWLIQDYGADLAGDWESSRKLLELITGLLTAYFAMVLLPKLAKINENKDLRSEILNNAIVLMLLSSVAFILLYVLRDQVYYIVFSPNFIFSSELMSSRAIGEFLRGLVWIFGLILVVKAKVKLYLLMGFIYAFILLCSSWFMIANYGLIGVNYAYVACNFLMLILSMIIFYQITLDQQYER